MQAGAGTGGGCHGTIGEPHSPILPGALYCGATVVDAPATKRFRDGSFAGGSGRAAVPSPQTDEAGQAVEVIKAMQRKSHHFALAWRQFCREFGGGTNDPGKHSPLFVTQFFDFIAHQALLHVAQSSRQVGPMALAMQVGAGCGRAADWGGCFGVTGEAPSPKLAGAVCAGAVASDAPVAKRHSDDAFASDSGRLPHPGSPLVDIKEYLVAQVKSFQKMGDQEKELWTVYCDTYLGGVRDPNRHDVDTLEEFCTNHKLPPPCTPGPWHSARTGAAPRR